MRHVWPEQMLAMHIYIVEATCFILNKDCNLVKIKMVCLKTKSILLPPWFSNLLSAQSCWIFFIFSSLAFWWFCQWSSKRLASSLFWFSCRVHSSFFKTSSRTACNLKGKERKGKVRYDLLYSAVFCAMLSSSNPTYQLTTLNIVHIADLVFNLSF